MKNKKYVAPAIEIITMQTEGMIAGSNPKIGIESNPNKVIDDSNNIFSIETEEPASFDLDDN